MSFDSLIMITLSLLLINTGIIIIISIMIIFIIIIITIRHRLASREGIVSLGIRHTVCVSTALVSALGGEGNVLYPMLSSYYYNNFK